MRSGVAAPTPPPGERARISRRVETLHITTCTLFSILKSLESQEGLKPYLRPIQLDFLLRSRISRRVETYGSLDML